MRLLLQSRVQVRYVSQMFRGPLFSILQVVAQVYQLCLAFSIKRVDKAPFQVSPIMPVL